MNSERGISAKFRRLTTPAKCLTDNPRGARHCGASSRRELVCGRSIRILTMMQSCASAATAPGGGPILSVGISAMFVLRFPPPRILSSAAREKPARAPNMVLSGLLVPVSPFSPLDVRRRPPVSRPS